MANDFSEIKSILSEYSQDIQDEIANEAIRIGKESAKDLKHTSPVKSGRYKKGWTSTVERGFSEIKVIVHNKTAYQLTHLLEHSHLLRNGQKSTPKKHIYPVEQNAVHEFELKVEQIIGGK